jgi:hypothetical protein
MSLSAVRPWFPQFASCHLAGLSDADPLVSCRSGGRFDDFDYLLGKRIVR